MKKSLTLTFWAAIALAAVAIFTTEGCNGSTSGTKENIDSLAAYSPTTGCLCESSWFPHDQTPPPAEGEGSPFDTSSTTNCIFHQWSWQQFLYLTKPVNNQPLFLSELQLVTAQMQPVKPVQGQSLVLTSINQAGSEGVLKTSPQINGTASTVYYSIHMNSTMFESSLSIGRKIAGDTIPQNNSLTHPVGSLELKVSWVDVNALPANAKNNYFTTTAAVEVSAGNYEVMEVALLGMHVVGRVINHPEFIWATFEHFGMNPGWDWTNMNASASTAQLLFNQGTVSDINGIIWDAKNNQPAQPSAAFGLYELGVPRQQGGGFVSTSQSEPENFDNIVEIDACVELKLTDVWKNYFYRGSIWINTDGLSEEQQADTMIALGFNIGNPNPGNIVRGSLACANTTMETFTQTFAPSLSAINLNNNANCFSCHTSESSVDSLSPLYVSHVFNDFLSSLMGKSVEEIRVQKLRKFLSVKEKLTQSRP